MTKGDIYVDFDDVLCETAQTISAIAAREFGITVGFDALHSFDVGLSFGLEPLQVDHLFRIVHRSDTLAAMRPIPGAERVLARWADAGWRVLVVTGRPPATHVDSREWIRRHAIPCAELIFVNKYNRDHAPAHGVPFLSLADLRRRDFCLAVDDAPEMTAYLAEHQQIPVALFDRPWNRAHPALPPEAAARIVRCVGWEDVGRQFPSPGRAECPGHGGPGRGLSGSGRESGAC